MDDLSARRGAARCVPADVRPASGEHSRSAKPPIPLASSAVCPEFAEQYRAHHQSLLRLAALLTGDERAADAVVADAFVALHSAWRAVGSGDRAWRYLLRLVIIRSRRVSRRCARQEPAAGPGARTAGAGGEAQTPRTTALLHTIPQRQREAVALTYYLDLSEDLAAAAMGVRKAAFRRMLAQGLTRLGPTLPVKP